MRIANVSDEPLARVEGPSTGMPKGEAPDVMSVQLLASLLSEMSDSPPFPSSPLPSPRSPSAAALHSLQPVASPRRAVLPPERAQHAKCVARCEDGSIAPDAAVASSGVPSGIGERRSAPAADARLRGTDARDYPLARALAELEAQDRAREMAAAVTRRVAPGNARHAERKSGDCAGTRIPAGGSDGCAFPRRSGSLVGRGAHARQQADGASGSSSSVDGSASRFSAFVASREAMVRALTAHLRRPSAEPASPHKASTNGAFTEPGPSEPGPSESAISEPAIRARSMTASGGRSATRPRTSGGERSERAIAGGEGWGGGAEGRSRAEHVRRRLADSAGEQGGVVGCRETAGGVGVVVQGGGRMGQWSDFGVWNSGAVVAAVGGGAGGADAGGMVRGSGSSGVAERWQAGRLGSAQQSMGPPAPRMTGGWRGTEAVRAPPTAVVAAACAGSASNLAGSAAAVGAGGGVAGDTATAGGLGLAAWPTHAALPPPMPRLPHVPLFPHSASMPLPPRSAPAPLLPRSAPIPLTPHSPPQFIPHSQPIPLRPHSAPATSFSHSHSAPAAAFPHSPSAPRLPHALGRPNTPSATPLPEHHPSATAPLAPIVINPLAPTMTPLAAHMTSFLPPHQGAWRVGAAAAKGTAAEAAAAGASGAAAAAGGMGAEEERMWCEFDAMLMGAPPPIHAHGTAVNPMAAHFMTAHGTSGDPLSAVGPSGGHPMGAAWSGGMVHGGDTAPVQADTPLAAHGTGGPLAELHTAPVPSGSGGSAEGHAAAGAEVGAEAEGGTETGDMSGMEVLGEGGGGAGGSGSSGGRGKNKSVVEKERRERISQELQRLRQTVRGRGDMAAMLDGAVAYVEQLKAQHKELEATLLQHQLTCTCPQCHQLGQP
ncbi:unnamed protein product [Closterium sp. NIES-64]|nr:unnamed protein product [Closterium sp. NIES-64]